jgi:hypothetical protein
MFSFSGDLPMSDLFAKLRDATPHLLEDVLGVLALGVIFLGALQLTQVL